MKALAWRTVVVARNARLEGDNVQSGRQALAINECVSPHAGRVVLTREGIQRLFDELHIARAGHEPLAERRRRVRENRIKAAIGHYLAGQERHDVGVAHPAAS